MVDNRQTLLVAQERPIVFTWFAPFQLKAIPLATAGLGTK